MALQLLATLPLHFVIRVLHEQLGRALNSNPTLHFTEQVFVNYLWQGNAMDLDVTCLKR